MRFFYKEQIEYFSYNPNKFESILIIEVKNVYQKLNESNNTITFVI